MKRAHTYLALPVCVGILLGVVTAGTAPAMQQITCEDPSIRKQAVVVARAINTAQIRSFQAKALYQPLNALGVTIPSGLDVQLVNSRAAYLFSVKDTREACRFTLFSDQEGLIYIAQPLQ